MLDLPEDIINVIVLKIGVKNALSLKAVSKYFNKIIVGFAEYQYDAKIITDTIFDHNKSFTTFIVGNVNYDSCCTTRLYKSCNRKIEIFDHGIKNPYILQKFMMLVCGSHINNVQIIVGDLQTQLDSNIIWYSFIHKKVPNKTFANIEYKVFNYNKTINNEQTENFGLDRFYCDYKLLCSLITSDVDYNYSTVANTCYAMCLFENGEVKIKRNGNLYNEELTRNNNIYVDFLNEDKYKKQKHIMLVLKNNNKLYNNMYNPKLQLIDQVEFGARINYYLKNNISLYDLLTIKINIH